MATTHQALPLSEFSLPYSCTTSHIAVHKSNASSSDFLTLWASNTTSNTIKLTTFYAPANTVDNTNESTLSISTVVSIPADSGKVLVEPGILLRDSQQLRVKATATGLQLTGYIYRRTEI